MTSHEHEAEPPPSMSASFMSERTALLAKARHKREEPGFMSRLDYFLVMPALLSNTLLAAFESTIAASIQSSIGAEFHASDNIAWVATSYLIVSTALSPLYGRASDLFGRTTVYLFAVIIFTLGCLLCGLSRSLGQMIAARAICGIGGAGLITGAQAVTWDILPSRLRPLYQAFNNTIFGMGAAFGAALGGFFADTIGWRSAYFVPIPLGVFGMTVFLTKVRPKLKELRGGEQSKIQAGDIDYLGSFLIMAAITLLLIVTNLGGHEIPWNSPLIPIAVVGVVLATIGFFRHERKAPLPVLPLSLLGDRHMTSLVLFNFFASMAIFGSLYLIPLFFQSTLLTTASVASRRLLYPTLSAPIGSVLTGIFLHRFREHAYITQRLGAFVLFSGTIALLALSFEDNRRKSELQFGVHLIWVHLGMGIGFISSLMNVLDMAGTEHASASSMVFLIRSLGGVIGISGSQAVLQNVLLQQLRANITGPHSKKVIRAIRESLSYLNTLEPDLRSKAINAYVIACRAAFTTLAVVGGLGFLSLLLGIGAYKTHPINDDMEEENRGPNRSPVTDPPLSSGIPTLE
ncbi:hypothetical protein I302_103250 [Kwoniella bestiolae CBS 10118]|uniref:Major facilitator superfamily (MFS) profile domain-containing protein n=1 Tax=Kwoniella bestiolae CBS 10118 TaxID=1296100 RepID=A0A1B9G7V4_9TREE|nr:hypothetical protein I302_01949 [Kwoniella bestiolae CBS 10118]OCF27114.1 hypothetical protein I302_01949 [Kwoniella bestiolae CBS 10118]